MPKLFSHKSAENFAEKMKKFQIQMSKIHPGKKRMAKNHDLPGPFISCYLIKVHVYLAEK